MGDTLDLYLLGVPLVAQFDVMGWLIFGTIVGILIGALPGISVTMGVAILAPLTFNMETVPAFALLLGAYAGAVYGGVITAILIRIPGETSSVMATLDGYPMTQRGEGGRAIAIATIASLFGGVISAIVLALLAPPLAAFALRFSAADFLAVAIFAFSVIAYVSEKSIVKGLLSGVIGLLLATVGLDPGMGFPRFTFGVPEMLNGIGLVPVMIGLFGLAEVLTEMRSPSPPRATTAMRSLGSMIPRVRELISITPAMIKATAIGVFVGVLPAAGAATASVVAYGICKRTSRHPERYGTGDPEALATVEASHNGSTGGDLVPTLSLGIPGSSSTAILMGALILHGMQPGPLLFTDHPDIVSSIFILLFLANFAFFIIGMLGAPLFARSVDIPKSYMLPAIAILCVIGAYALNNNVFDIGVMLAAGVLGVIFRATGIPAAPLILGMILGQMVEGNLQRTLILAYGRGSDVFTHPISMGFLLATLLFLFGPWVWGKVVRKKRPAKFAEIQE